MTCRGQKQAFDWTSQYVEQDENRLQKENEQKWKCWQMSNRHCWKIGKEVEALSVYIDAGPSPVLERRNGGGGMEVVELRAQARRAGRGRQLPRPIIPDTSRPSKAHFPFITTYHRLDLHVAQSKVSSCSMTAA